MDIVYAIPTFLMGFGVCFCCMKAYNLFCTIRSLKEKKNDNKKADENE